MFDSYVMAWRFKYAILFGLMFLVSVYYSWQELVYVVRGNTAQAMVTETYTMKSGRFRQHEERVLEYKFAEAGGLSRRGADTISMDEPVPGQILVQYTPGEKGRSRIAGHVRWMWLCIFGVAVGGLAFAIYRLNKHMDEVMAPRRRKA